MKKRGNAGVKLTKPSTSFSKAAAFSGEGGEAPAALVVSVVEFTMYEARGHASNSLYFPLFDER